MRKIFPVLFAAMLILLTLSGCGGEKAEVLNVYNWGEYISDGSEDTLDVNKEFENYYFEKYGKRLKVNYTTYASNEDMYNKLRSGGVSYDVVVPSDYMIARMIDENLLLKLDFSNIPNFECIDPQYKNAYYDEKSEYSVPYQCGYVGIIYNTTLVDKPYTDWDALWDEDLKGQILQFNNPRDAFGTAMYWNGIDVNTTDEGEWREAKDLLAKQKPLVQSYVMDEVFNKMKNGSAAVAPYYAGDFFTMYEDNEDLDFFYPESGTNMFVDAMCIPSCAKNKEIAEEYINFMLSEEIAVANAEYTCYASPNLLVSENEDYIAYMTEIHPEAIGILYPVGGIKSSYFETLDSSTQNLENNLWEELKIDNAVEPWVYIFAGSVVLGVLILLGAGYIKKKINARYM